MDILDYSEGCQMLMCPKCGGIAYRNSYFGRITCQACGWKTTIDQYEKEKAVAKEESYKELNNDDALLAHTK